MFRMRKDLKKKKFNLGIRWDSMDKLTYSIIYTREKKILGKDLQDEINSIYFLVAKQKEKKNYSRPDS
jgi:hypothetical protein